MKKAIAAEEKHYQKLNNKLRHEIKTLTEQRNQYRSEKMKLSEEHNKLQQKNEQYKEWIERLLEYTNLNEDDIKKACEKDKAIGSLLGLFKVFGSLRLY